MIPCAISPQNSTHSTLLFPSFSPSTATIYRPPIRVFSDCLSISFLPYIQLKSGEQRAKTVNYGRPQIVFLFGSPRKRVERPTRRAQNVHEISEIKPSPSTSASSLRQPKSISTVCCCCCSSLSRCESSPPFSSRSAAEYVPTLDGRITMYDVIIVIFTPLLLLTMLYINASIDIYIQLAIDVQPSLGTIRNAYRSIVSPHFAVFAELFALLIISRIVGKRKAEC